MGNRSSVTAATEGEPAACAGESLRLRIGRRLGLANRNWVFVAAGFAPMPVAYLVNLSGGPPYQFSPWL